MFISRQKIDFILHALLEILQRYCKPVVLGTLGIPGYIYQETMQLAQTNNLNVLIIHNRHWPRFNDSL